jgi:hypothetical protein
MTTILQAGLLAAGLLVAPIAMAQPAGSQTGGDTLKSRTAPDKTGGASAPLAAGGGAALQQTTKPDGEKQVRGDTAGASTGPTSSKQPAPK